MRRQLLAASVFLALGDRGNYGALSRTNTINAPRVPDFRGLEIHPGYNARVNPGSQKKKALAAAVSAAALVSMDVGAVYLDPEGLGQALIYPYYTVRSAGGNPFNTYVSVVNHEATTKALRVRFREGRNGREVAGFNLFLSPFDAWAASLVPTADGAKVVTIDNSCTNPPFAAAGGQRELVFSTALYSGANSDGMGDGGDRLREGYLEVIEMATLSGSGAAAVTHGSSGVPDNCAVVQSASFVPAVEPPTGGVSGSATLINVASGMDFTFNAEALVELTTQPFYRDYTDPYPDWNAAEVTPLSYFSSQGKLYRFVWARGVDAVSSVLMRSTLENEFVLDAATRSETAWILTFPTRRFYASGSATTPPFTASPQSTGICERLTLTGHGREEQTQAVVSSDIGIPAPHAACGATSVLSLRRNDATTRRIDSTNSMPTFPPSFPNGWLSLTFNASADQNPGLRSLPNSWSRDVDGAQVEPGIYVLRGLPVVGFMARTFENGTLSCAATACQGNYGGNFPHRVRRSVSRAP